MTLIEHAFIGTHTIRLTEEEKAQIFSCIQERIHAPVLEERKEDVSRSRSASVLFQKLTSLLSFHHAGLAFALLLAIIAGATVSTAAQAALPGEVFYPLKQAGEKVAGNFYITPEARAAWEEEKLLRRLEEAEILMSMNRLGARERQEIVGTLRTHIDAVQEEIDTLADQGNMEGAQEIDASLGESLQTHHEVLKTLAAETQNKEQKLEVLQVIHQVEEVLLPIQASVASSAASFSSHASEASSHSSSALESRTEHHLLQRSADRKIRDASDLLLQMRLNEGLDTEKVDQLARLYAQSGKLLQSGSYVPSLQLSEEILRRGHEMLQPASSSSSVPSTIPAVILPTHTGSAVIFPEVTSSSL